MKDHGWFFRAFGFWFSRDEWVRTQTAYKTDIEIARRAREREYDSLRDGLLEAKKDLGSMEGQLDRERSDWRGKEVVGEHYVKKLEFFDNAGILGT